MARSRKKFALSVDNMEPLAEGYGGCIATDMITVDGCQVGYMYRAEPNNDQDSGWIFMSGKESQAYMDDAGNGGIYDVNTIANCDRDIILFLDAPIGTAFERQGKARRFVQVEGELWEPGTKADDVWPPPGFPLVEGDHQLTDIWAIHLSEPFARRIEENSLVLWRPGLTIWMTVWNNDNHQSQAERLAWLKGIVSPKRFAERESCAQGVTRFSYRLHDESDDGPVESISAVIFDDDGHLQMAVYFDDPAEEAIAQTLVNSVIRTG